MVSIGADCTLYSTIAETLPLPLAGALSPERVVTLHVTLVMRPAQRHEWLHRDASSLPLDKALFRGQHIKY